MRVLVGLGAVAVALGAVRVGGGRVFLAAIVPAVLVVVSRLPVMVRRRLVTGGGGVVVVAGWMLGRHGISSISTPLENHHGTEQRVCLSDCRH